MSQAINPRKPCGSSCALECTFLISEHQRAMVLKYFNELRDVNLRRYFVQKCVHQDLETRERKYGFTINGKRIPVCRQFFISTLTITESFIKQALETVYERKDKLDESDPRLVEGIMNHIKSVPRIVHCTLDDNNEKEYIESSLKFDELYKFYRKFATKHNYPIADVKTYRKHYDVQDKVFAKCRDTLPVMDVNEVTIMTLKAGSKKQ